MAEIAAAVGFLHNHGIVHFDLVSEEVPIFFSRTSVSGPLSCPWALIIVRGPAAVDGVALVLDPGEDLRGRWVPSCAC